MKRTSSMGLRAVAAGLGLCGLCLVLPAQATLLTGSLLKSTDPLLNTTTGLVSDLDLSLDTTLEVNLTESLSAEIGTSALLSNTTSLILDDGGKSLSSTTDLCLQASLLIGSNWGTTGSGCTMDGGTGGYPGSGQGVPEPGTAALLAVSAVALWGLRRRREPVDGQTRASRTAG